MTDVGELEEAAYFQPSMVAGLVHDMRYPIDHDHWVARLHDDPRFALEMRLCRTWRIPHSMLLSWAPEDREKALALEVHESQRCPECGTHPQDWPDEEAPPFKVESDRCFACMALGDWWDWWRSQHTHGDKVDERQMRGVRTRFVLNDSEDATVT